MKIKQLLAVAGLFFASASVMAQEMPTMPVDPEVRVGHLDNGLTYYIRHNNNPEGVANFYIAQKVGSINEDDDQRGLAHFLEHMAFNGSEHFPGNGIIDYTRSLGVEFGRDLNAYTSIDRTVYNINNVPTARQTAVDSCLLILKDWSNGLTLDAGEIDKERGVVHGEWRLGSGAMQRIRDAAWPQMLKDSKYGNRLPIGLMEIIDNFTPQTLRAYYEKWYRPDNQGLIIVGDVDVDKVEAKIKELWAGVTVPADAVKIPHEAIPDNDDAIYVIGQDKEMQQNMYMIMMKHDGLPDEMKPTMMSLIFNFGGEMTGMMLNNRLQEAAQSEGSAFLVAQGSDGKFLSTKAKDAFTTIVIPKPGQDIEAIKQVTQELNRVNQYGFTATEYERAKDDYLSQLKKLYDNRAKIKNDQYANDYIENFLENEPMPSIEDQYNLTNQVVKMLPVEVVNELSKEMITANDTNLVVAGFLREAEGIKVTTVDELKGAIAGARAEKLEAYVDNVITEPLMTALPKKGAIKKETENKQLGYKQLTLSNGVKVILKKTDFKDNEILMRAYADGGLALYGPKDDDNLKILAMGFAEAGLGNFSQRDLTKALAGKQAGVDFDIDVTDQTVTGHSTPDDLETLMQLIYLQFTAIKSDKAAYDQTTGYMAEQFKNASLNPQLVFTDSLQSTLTNHYKLSSLPKAETFENADYERILQIQRERLANAADYTFVFVGNFDEALMRQYLEQYIASLPANKKLTKKQSVKHVWNGHVENRFKAKMQDGQSIVVEAWRSNGVPYTVEGRTLLKMAADVLEAVYLKSIREEHSASYTVSAQADVDTDADEFYYTLLGYCPCDPDKAQLAESLLKQGIEDAAKAIDPEVLAKVKEAMLNHFDEDSKSNNHWLNYIFRNEKYGTDFYNGYKERVSAVTPEQVSAFIRDVIMKPGHHAEIVMMPE